jgi:phosphohistidine swiveling domain-containing protein
MSEAASFAVQWESAEDAELFWTWDQVHSPAPQSTLGASLWPSVVSAGAAAAVRELALPIVMRLKAFNGYLYRTMLPSPDMAGPPRIAQAAANLREHWDTVYRPELERDLSYLMAKDLAALSTADLHAHLEEALDLARRHWAIHMLTVFPLFHSGGRLAELYAQVAGPDHPEDAPYRLLEGLDNKTLEGNRALLRLAEVARATPEVAKLITEEAGGLSRGVLAELPGGQDFLDKLDAFLNVWGYRSSAGDDVADSTWRENPSFVLDAIRDYLSRPPVDLEAHLREQAAERERLVAETFASIADPALRGELQAALRIAQANWPLREDHAYYIDQTSLSLLRRIFLEVGRRLTSAGTLNQADDVFFLTLEEVLAALGATTSPNLQATVTSRQRERQEQRKLQPPPFMGTPPPPGAPGPDPELVKFFGRPPTAAATSTTIPGAAASRGTATGPARVLRSFSELDRVRPGDILVCQTTTPPWTPLFSVIAGLVTNSGGVLSHGAIVAREYRLPAVVGTQIATTRIRDGQRITVDGTRGVVTLED